ncbi:unnamed protein product, partial [Sphacelaria rigidula]
GKVDAVAVGADRIAANGDTANKIGTLQLAIAAAYYGVPFLVVAPLTSCDPETATGSDIEIEERAESELKIVAGVKIAPDGIGAWNPAFDVTPGDLITAIVTDKGVIRPVSQGGGGTKKASFDVKAFVASQVCVSMCSGAGDDAASAAAPDAVAETPAAEVIPQGYYELTGEGVVAKYLEGLPRVMELLGASSAADIVSEEFGDGNLNLVFKCSGVGDGAGTVIVKQALPYVRCIGE